MNILIAGAGAIGSNLTALLANDLRGKHEITVLDFDTVEERNVRAGTQFYFRDQIGIPKVEALQYNVYKQFEKEIKTKNVKLCSGNLSSITDDDVLIDCFDNQESRQLIQNFWNDFLEQHGLLQRHLSILHVGFSDKLTFAIEWAENYQVPSDITSGIDICELEGVGSFIKMAAGLASLTVQEFIRIGAKREFIGNGFSVTEMK